MKRGAICLVLTCFIAAALVFVSCNTTTSILTSTPTLTPTSTSISTPTSTLTSTPKLTPTSTQTSTSATTPTNSWTEKPQYGGTFVYQVGSDARAPFISVFDPYYANQNQAKLWEENLAGPDMSVSRALWDFKTTFYPMQDHIGKLAETWDISSDWTSFTFHIRKGVYWQNKPPVNGREFTAYDVEWNYDRVLGIGDGFTKPSPYLNLGDLALIASVTATDKYTIVYKLTTPSREQLRSILDDFSTINDMVPREVVEQYGNMSDWRNVVGTGPFILKDYLGGSSLTADRNPNYWGYDPFFPQNKLPYLDEVKIVAIPDVATALAAVRTGKVDLIESIPWTQAANLAKSNPELQQVTRPAFGQAISPMIDKKPFDDIRVRTAMQMALDLPTIAKSFYGGTVNPTPIGCVGQKGYYIPFGQWPADLQAEYTYNPTAAKKLLADAGYPNGFDCTITTQPAYDQDLLQIIKAYFSQIGINMNIQVMDAASFNAYTASSKQQLSSWRCAAPNPPIQCLNEYWSGTTAAYTRTHIKDTVYDGLIVKAKASLDEAEFSGLIQQADMRVITQHWGTFVVAGTSYCISQPWLKRFSGEAAVSSWLYRYLWIDQNLKKAMGH